MDSRDRRTARRIACAIIIYDSAETPPIHTLAESCFRFTPLVAIREGEAVFLEIGGSRKLFSEDSLRLRLTALARRFGCRARIGIGDSAAEALALARFGADPPLEALYDYASPFRGDPDLNKEIYKVIEKLRMLGLKSLRDFRSLAATGLASRFGKDVVGVHARVCGDLQAAWPEFRAEEKIVEKSDVDDDVSIQGLTFILRGLTDRAFARLWARSERVSVIQVKFDLAKWSSLKSHVREWRIELPLPQGSSAGLIPIIQEKLMGDLSKLAFGAPVRAVSFEVVETVPGNGAQKDFFNQTEQESEVWNALVGRLSYKLGNGRVFTALPVERYLPEKAWVRKLEPMKAAELSFRVPGRPARLLRKPEPLEKDGNTLIHIRTGKRWMVSRWEGPERISGEWWVGLKGPHSKDPTFEGFFRDYYKVVAKSGEQLWIYFNRRTRTPTIFLHGYFD